MHPFAPQKFFDLTTHPFSAFFDKEVAVWEFLLKIESFLKGQPLGRICCPIPEGAYLVNREKISIGEGSIVEPGAYIQGPCLIGKGCVIRHGAYLRGNVMAEEGCVIGHATEVKNSILLQGAKAGHFAYVGDSILGREVNLGAGVKCANLKLSHGEIWVSDGAKRTPTGMAKLGAILGDFVQLGCNSVTNPGTVMGKHSSCYPCLNIGGYIPAGQVVRKELLPVAPSSRKD